MKKVTYSLVLILIVSFTAGTVLSADYSSNNTINSSKQVKENTQPTSEDHEIKKSFQKIAALGYNVKKCNCEHKSKAFANKLVEKGAKNVYLITIEHESGEYSHMVVSWEGKIYDATITPAVYGIDENKYLNGIRKYGFTGLRVKAPYSSNKSN